MAVGVGDGINIKVRLVLGQALKGLHRLGQSLLGVQRSAQPMINGVNAAALSVRNLNSVIKQSTFTIPTQGLMRMSVSANQAATSLKKVNTQIHTMRKGFPAWAFGIMFMGMALRRLFDGIWRASRDTFQEISHSVDDNVTAFDELNNVWTYLKFVAGQALEPIAAWLVPIVMRVAEWIKNNPGLFRFAMILLGIVAFLASIVGSLAMWIAALKQLSSLVAVFSFLKKILGFLAYKLIPAVGKVLAFAFGKTPIGWIILLIGWLIAFAKRVGGIPELFKSVVRGILRFGLVVKSFFAGLWAMIKEVFKHIGNAVISGLEWTINKAIDLINVLINQLNKVLDIVGIDISPIRHVDMSGLKSDAGNIGKAFSDAYADSMWEGMDKLDEIEWLQPKKGYADSFDSFGLPVFDEDLEGTPVVGETVYDNKTVNNEINIDTMNQAEQDEWKEFLTQLMEGR